MTSYHYPHESLQACSELPLEERVSKAVMDLISNEVEVGFAAFDEVPSGISPVSLRKALMGLQRVTSNQNVSECNSH